MKFKKVWINGGFRTAYRAPCAYCRKMTPWKRTTELRRYKNFYCSFECSKSAEIRRKEFSCAVCSKIVLRTPSNLSKWGKYFCSASCSAKFHNERRWGVLRRSGKLKTKVCIDCGGISSRSTGRCRICIGVFLIEKTGKTRLGTPTNDRYPQAKYARIRSHAKNVARLHKIEEKCSVCGYETVIELAHIKPIKDFHPSALLSEVNHRRNLVYLCPNHHTEYDRGFLKKSNLRYNR
jgi:hypothetical protein